MIPLNTNLATSCLQAALVAVLVSLPTACVGEVNRAKGVDIRPVSSADAKESQLLNADVEALVNLGPRVAGTPVMEKASAYLIEEYRKAGYTTEVQTFTYEKFQDLGSNLTVDGTKIDGVALNGSVAGKLNAPLVVVPKVGRPEDFASVNVKGAIALVRRGELRFSDKAENAAAAGAVGLVIVNTEPGNIYGTLADEAKIPVLGLSGQQGAPLLKQAQNRRLTISMNVNTEQRTVTGRNIVARVEGATQPKIILGGHYDSVAGSPGANDNASGTAVLLALARNLSGTPLARQVWFVAFDGEEDGLHGSRAFVNAQKPQFLSQLKGMINFDMVGVNNRLQIDGTSSLSKFAQGGGSQVPSSSSVGGSDHASFAAKGVPILFFHRGLEPNYHKPSDKTVDPKLLDETAEVALGIVKRLLVAE